MYQRLCNHIIINQYKIKLLHFGASYISVHVNLSKLNRPSKRQHILPIYTSLYTHTKMVILIFKCVYNTQTDSCIIYTAKRSIKSTQPKAFAEPQAVYHKKKKKNTHHLAHRFHWLSIQKQQKKKLEIIICPNNVFVRFVRRVLCFGRNRELGRLIKYDE